MPVSFWCASLDERLGLGTLISEHLNDSRQGLNTQLSAWRISCGSRSTAGSRVTKTSTTRSGVAPTFHLIGSPMGLHRFVDGLVKRWRYHPSFKNGGRPFHLIWLARAAEASVEQIVRLALVVDLRPRARAVPEEQPQCSRTMRRGTPPVERGVVPGAERLRRLGRKRLHKPSSVREVDDQACAFCTPAITTSARQSRPGRHPDGSTNISCPPSRCART